MNSIKMYALSLLVAGMAVSSCTDLAEKMYSDLPRSTGGDGNVNPAELLVSAYDALNGPHQLGDRWGMNEISGDAAVRPTRGGDWDDGGKHRAIHMHTWNADNSYMSGAFDALHTAQFRASNVVKAANATAQQKAEARFIRAFTMYDVLSLWGFAVHREDMRDVKALPEVMQPQAAIAFIQKELEESIADLPEFKKTEANIASKHAARFLLAKLHLNKAVFLNRENPAFDPQDMNKVLELAKAIKDDPRGLALSVGGKEYFDNFAPNNDQVSKENIYTLINQSGLRGGITSITRNVSHYNMDPSGWNGAATLKAFYESYTPGDVRLGMAYNGYSGEAGRINPANAFNVGFWVGQQYNMKDGSELESRNPAGAKLVFVPEISLRTSGATLETAGVRVAKYAFDYASDDNGQGGDNDWAVFRYADLLLMEAEAILRGGTPGTQADALAIVNGIRTARNAGTPFATLTEDNLLAERGRELYWEGWRREDLIRFGKFLQPTEIRTKASPANRLLFAVPSQQLVANPNLDQNPGY